MRDPLGLNERFFAFAYPLVMIVSEASGLRETRRKLVGQASGRTLEIGAGSGYNLPHYTSAVSELIVSEPSSHMQAHLRRRLSSDPPPVGSWELTENGAERLPFPSDSFDTVVGTLVHCTIPSPALALAEIARVLRPDGRYLFLEHVHAGDGVLGMVQDLVEIPHRYFAAGCYPNRRTEQLLADSPLVVERLDRGSLPLVFPTVRPTIMGVARPASS